MRCAGRRLVASVARRGLGRRGGPLRPREPGGDGGRDPRGARPARRAARARARPRRGRSPGRGRASSSSRGTGDSRSASTRRRSARRAPAPPATCAASSPISTCDVEEVSFPAELAARERGGGRALVPAPARPRRRRPPLPDVPRALPLEDAARRHGPRPRGAAPPGVVQPAGRRRYSRLAVPRVVRAADRVIAVSEFTKRELVDAARRPGRPRSGSCRTPSRTSSRRRARAPRATTCSRSGRSSRARTWRGSPRPSTASCGSSAPAAGADVEPPANVTLARRGARTTSSRPSTAAPAASSTPRSTRASGSRSPRRSRAAAPW